MNLYGGIVHGQSKPIRKLHLFYLDGYLVVLDGEETLENIWQDES